MEISNNLLNQFFDELLINKNLENSENSENSENLNNVNQPSNNNTQVKTNYKDLIINEYNKLINDTTVMIYYYENNYVFKKHYIDTLKNSLNIYKKTLFIIKNYSYPIYESSDLYGSKGLLPGTLNRINMIIKNGNLSEYDNLELTDAYKYYHESEKTNLDKNLNKNLGNELIDFKLNINNINNNFDDINMNINMNLNNMNLNNHNGGVNIEIGNIDSSSDSNKSSPSGSPQPSPGASPQQSPHILNCFEFDYAETIKDTSKGFFSSISDNICSTLKSIKMSFGYYTSDDDYNKIV